MSVAPVSTFREGKMPRHIVCLTFDFDTQSGFIARGMTTPTPLSRGEFGAMASGRILTFLKERGIKATWFTPGFTIETFPSECEAVVRAGHEVAHHGYTHTSPHKLTREQEEAELVRGLEILRSFGAAVTGYRSPSWDLSPHTLGLLHEHGITYSSNLMDDIRPYRIKDPPLVEVPISWILDDAPHFWFDGASWTKTISTTGHVRTLWAEEFLGIRELGGACVFTMHPQIIGRPSRLTFLDQFLSFVTGHSDVWVTTTAQIASRA